MNVMLVDSDRENIKNFRTYIRTSFPNLKVVGHFSNPDKDIIAAIQDAKPSLIIADIKFFGGVRFMRFKEVHDKFPEVRFIVYGTFNDTDYMKRARDFGVIDYMYRPVKPTELARCLNLALGHFKKVDDQKQNSQQLSQKYQDELSHYETMFLRRLAEGHILNENEIREAMTYFQIKLDPSYLAAVVHIDHFRQIALTLTESEKHLLIFKILQSTKEALKEWQTLVFMMNFHSVAVLLGGDHAIADTVAIFEEVKQAVFERTDIRVSVGIGRTYANVTDICVSYREADAAFRYRNRMGYNTVIPLEFVEPDNRITYRYPTDREERLIYMAVVGDYDYCKQVLLELFDALAQGGALPEGLLPKILMNIVIRISRYISEQNLPFASQVMRLFPTAEILAVKNLEEGLTTFDKALEKFCNYMRTYDNKNLTECTKMLNDM